MDDKYYCSNCTEDTEDKADCSNCTEDTEDQSLFRWDRAGSESALGAFILLFVFSFFLSLFLKGGYLALDGADTLCHLYRAQEVRSSITQGVLYPLYDPKWYNGVEFMRYWGPLPLYILALSQWICRGDTLGSYPVFLSWIFFFGSCGWLCFGIRYQRVKLSLTIAFIWFFSPENIRIYTTDGNVPRIVINALLPWFLYTIWQVVEERRAKDLPWTMLIFLLILLCHLGIALIVLSSIFLLLLLQAVSRKDFRPLSILMTGFLLVFLTAGVWLVPAMFGGAIENSNTNQVMKYFFQSLWESLNPMARLRGDMLVFYYGISFFVLSLMGVFLSLKRTRIIFAVGLVLFLFTGLSAFDLFAQLPFSQFLWMIRFVPVSAALILMGVLLWDSLKKPLLIILCLLLVLDCIPSGSYLAKLRTANSAAAYEEGSPDAGSYEGMNPAFDSYEETTGNASYGFVEQSAESKGLQAAKELTRQRMSVMDLSSYGSFAPYYIAGVPPKTQYAFGAGWEGAATGANLVRLNSALELGHYQYLFDRSLELGIDVVSVPLTMLKSADEIGRLVQAGAETGYQLLRNASGNYIFRYPVSGQFGTVPEYKNLAIGESAGEITLLFPDFKAGPSDQLEDYSMEELAQYKTIYLSGFLYENRRKAEKQLTALADKGVTIIIDMNQLPQDRETGIRQIFRVFAQPITFNDEFPSLLYEGVRYNPQNFSAEYNTWNTVYLDGVSHIQGQCEFQNRQVVFAGTAEHERIHFLGLNLIYHGILTRDPEVIEMAEALFGETYGTLPKREVVPISIRFSENGIMIDSPRDGVNTGLAWLDIFYSEAKLKQEQNLLIVPSGRVEILLRYPYLLDGIVISICGLILSVLFLAHRKYLFRNGILWHKFG